MKRKLLTILITSLSVLTSSSVFAKTNRIKKVNLVCVPDYNIKKLVHEKRPVGVNNSWEFLNMEFAERLNVVLEKMKESGYEMVMLEGYRSPERQDELMNSGKNITNAKKFQSFHQFGLAVDMSFVKNNKPYMNIKDKWVMDGYKLYGQFAQEQGLVWGGKWTMGDYGHVELHAPGVFKLAKNYPNTKHELISMINTNYKFAKL